ncbi:hypothetical protein JOB18_044067 [Solea senegalensis]|uniref:Uncharacterized protein n=1 Tax=Solea senegalensis TaxID=28829 RepID=A0AAV6SN22_SOLSE|nr:hypothetical protein JOB18_044067 [Solea senegalensis]
MSKDCNKTLDCETYQCKHPTLLHIDARTSNKEPQQNHNSAAPKQTSINSVQVSADTVTGARKECALANVPVQVEAAKGSKRSYQIMGLEVGNLDGGEFIDLPEVYTQTKIPVSKENLFTQSELRKWSYLYEIQVEEIDADIELLIGKNVPKALERWQMINSQINGPYTVKTLFGWVVNGPLKSTSVMGKGGTSMTVNRISMELLRQYNQEFPGKESEEKKEMSCKSLNGELLPGPDLTNSLLGVLLQFRQERIAIMADIEVMYY